MTGLVPFGQVGQYLMTLPQHLEPFMTQHDPTLGRALQSGVMPYRLVSLSVETRHGFTTITHSVADVILSVT